MFCFTQGFVYYALIASLGFFAISLKQEKKLFVCIVIKLIGFIEIWLYEINPLAEESKFFAIYEIRDFGW
tara:strand:- start:1093 stop:1302 length:210 start_codon:yes stop_codon:yes gene_type:complete